MIVCVQGLHKLADIKRIDEFFNGSQPLEIKPVSEQNKRAKLVRGAKLIMPSLAAVLVGLLVLYPSLKQEDVVADLEETLPRKGELEKLHIENTEISITDKDNKVSQLFADQIDETTPGSKLMKIINPRGELPAGSKDERVKVSSDLGYYNQTANTLRVESNVKAVYSDGTIVDTQEAFYDFKKAYGSGDKDVYAHGSWGKLWAEGFVYNQDQEILTLKGKSKINNEIQTMTADKEVRYYRQANRLEADTNVKILDKENTLYADRIKAFLRNEGKISFERIEAYDNVKIINGQNVMNADKTIAYFDGQDISLAQAYGNVKIVNDKNTIYADKAQAFFSNKVMKKIEAEGNVKVKDKEKDMQADKVLVYFRPESTQEIDKVEAFGKVKIVTSDGFVQGDYGLYNPQNDEMEIRKNVVISKDGSVIYGDKAVTNLKTSVSKVYMDSSDKRVTGVISGNTIRGSKNEKK